MCLNFVETFDWLDDVMTYDCIGALCKREPKLNSNTSRKIPRFNPHEPNILNEFIQDLVKRLVYVTYGYKIKDDMGVHVKQYNI